MKKISNNQGRGYIGEEEFRLWATKFGWLPTDILHDHGLDFICQICGSKVGKKSAEMPGNLLSVSVRSTEADGDTVKITRDDAELLLRTNTPMVFAIVQRGSQQQMGKIAVKFPDEPFVRELEAFLYSGAESHLLRFSEAISDEEKIRYNTERLLNESYVDKLARVRAKLKLEGIIPDAKIEIIHAENGVSAIVRSAQFSDRISISQRPDVLNALHDVGIPFDALLPLTGSALEVSGGTQQRSELEYVGSQPPRGSSLSGASKPLGGQTPLDEGLVRLIDRLRKDLALWNYGAAGNLAIEVEGYIATEAFETDIVTPDIMILLARAHLCCAEMRRTDSADHTQRANKMIMQAEILLAGNADHESEITALKASYISLEKDSTVGLALLKERMDPFAIRTRVALLLSQQRVADAVNVLAGLEPHERWCDMAVAAYALNDNLQKARELVQWARDLPEQNRYPQCVVRMADAIMTRALNDYTVGANILPQDIKPHEREKLQVVIDEVEPILRPIIGKGAPSSGLDMTLLRIAWQANHLLQCREKVRELMGVMARATPIPLDVARGVVSGYIGAPADLPERLRQDYPNDYDAGILATVVQSSSLGQHSEAYINAKALLPLANTQERKAEIFRLFQQLWQNLDGPVVAECEDIAKGLIAHDSSLSAMFNAAIALRKGHADEAIEILDRGRAEEDPYWLQLRANAHLQRGQFEDALNYLLSAVKKTYFPELLHKAGAVAVKVNRLNDAIWCYERLLDIQPGNVAVLGNLAYIYTFVLHDYEKAAIQFRALREAEPDNLIHSINLAACLTQLFRPEESLALYKDICNREKPALQAVLGCAQLQNALGHPTAALDLLKTARQHYWNAPSFLLAFMTTATAAGDDAVAYEALKVLDSLRGEGKIDPDTFRAVPPSEVLNMVRENYKNMQRRDEQYHIEMLKGRMPWMWAEQMSSNATYWGWRIRTQEFGWINDDPANRARYSIYSTNSFHARAAGGGARQLVPLECPPPKTRIVIDITALITLDRLGLLERAAEYFGEILVPVGYLPSVLDDSRQMIMNQCSQKLGAERIMSAVNGGRIIVVGEGLPGKHPVVNEFSEGTDHCYRLIDIVRPVYDAGGIATNDYDRISSQCVKPSAVNDHCPSLVHLQDVMLDLSTLEVLTHLGLLDAIARFYKIHITDEARREIVQRLTYLAEREEARQWHMGLWTRIRSDARFRFVACNVPDEIRGNSSEPKDYMPFLANFVARDKNVPLLADDRVCQAMRLNEVDGSACAAFGSDTVITALQTAGRLEALGAVAAFSHLMNWRYRFIVPPPGVLKEMADQYRGSSPGRILQATAEYVHDCMRDSGLFSGPEKTDIGDSMAMRYYLAWVSVVAEFLVLVWADELYTEEVATRLTKWSVRELLPSLPRVFEAKGRMQMGMHTPQLFLSHVLLRMGAQFGNSRMSDAMNAIQKAMCLEDDEYSDIITGILNDTARTAPKP